MTSFKLLFVLASTVSASCPNGWVTNNDFCYHFSNDKLTWADSFVMCSTMGGILVEVHDEAEKNFLDKAVRQFYRDYWIGATDSELEGTFTWATSKLPVTVANFIHQPDNAGGNENCIEIVTNEEWNDSACSSLKNYICQKTDLHEEGGPFG